MKYFHRTILYTYKLIYKYIFPILLKKNKTNSSMLCVLFTFLISHLGDGMMPVHCIHTSFILGFLPLQEIQET